MLVSLPAHPNHKADSILILLPARSNRVVLLHRVLNQLSIDLLQILHIIL